MTQTLPTIGATGNMGTRDTAPVLMTMMRSQNCSLGSDPAQLVVYPSTVLRMYIRVSLVAQ